MSDSQQVTTQPEEVKEPQQAGDVQVESANDKVVEPTEKPVDGTNSNEQVEPKSNPDEATEQQQPTASEPVGEKAVSEEKVAENGTKALDAEEQKVEQAEEAKEVTPVEEKETPPAAEAEKVAEANGETVAQTEPVQQQQQEQPAQAEETNGVSKRKVENGADTVDEEKSPKKAKVVDEGDQSAQAVEERAA